MSKQKSVVAAQGASTTQANVSIESLMAQFAQMQALMATLVPAVKEPANVPVIRNMTTKSEVKIAKVPAVKEPAKVVTRKEAIQAWKAKKDAKTTEQPTTTAILQVSEKGFLLVGNMKELEILRTTQGLEKYLTYVKRKSVAGKVYDGFSFSYKRVEMIKKAFAIK